MTIPTLYRNRHDGSLVTALAFDRSKAPAGFLTACGLAAELHYNVETDEHFWLVHGPHLAQPLNWKAGHHLVWSEGKFSLLASADFEATYTLVDQPMPKPINPVPLTDTTDKRPDMSYPNELPDKPYENPAPSPLELDDAASAAVATHPRVSLDDIKNAIAAERYLMGSDFFTEPVIKDPAAWEASKNLTICLLVLKNGFTVIGKSAPASPENFNIALGKKFAREDAMRQLWPLMGFALRERLAGRKDLVG